VDLYGAGLYGGGIIVQLSHNRVDEWLPIGLGEVWDRGCGLELRLGLVEVWHYFLRPVGVVVEGGRREGRWSLWRIGLLLSATDGKGVGVSPPEHVCKSLESNHKGHRGYRGCRRDLGRKAPLTQQTVSGPRRDSSLLRYQREEQVAARLRGVCTCYCECAWVPREDVGVDDNDEGSSYSCKGRSRRQEGAVDVSVRMLREAVISPKKTAEDVQGVKATKRAAGGRA
jgi:hypothetical protein